MEIFPKGAYLSLWSEQEDEEEVGCPREREWVSSNTFESHATGACSFERRTIDYQLFVLEWTIKRIGEEDETYVGGIRQFPL